MERTPNDVIRCFPELNQAPEPASCYNRSSVKHPLIGPLAAIAAGILVARFVPFHQSELLAAAAAFFLLGLLALARKSRALAAVCCLLALFSSGSLIALLHQPGPPPEIDAEAREIVILGGCGVEPPPTSPPHPHP